MANATAIPVTDLVAATPTTIGTATAQVATFDTGTSGTASIDVDGKTDRLILEITNGTTDTVEIEVEAGTNIPAFRTGLGELEKTAIATSARVILGPFESARHVNTSGDMLITVKSESTNALSCSVRAFRLPLI